MSIFADPFFLKTLNNLEFFFETTTYFDKMLYKHVSSIGEENIHC